MTRKLLKQWLNKTLNWNELRLEFLVRLLIALQKVKTMNLSEVTRVFVSNTKKTSVYRQIQRFFSEYPLSEEDIANIIIRKIGKRNKLVLIMEQIEWRFGQKGIKLLILAVKYKETAFPILWKVVGRYHRPNAEMRKELIEKFIMLFDKKIIAYLIENDEFSDKNWIGYLHAQKIKFYVRIRKEVRITRNGRLINIKKRLERLNKEPSLNLKNCKIYDNFINLTAIKLSKNHYLLFISNRSPKRCMKIYQEYLKTRDLLTMLKNKGFNFRDTRLNQSTKISRMIGILAIAFLFDKSQ